MLEANPSSPARRVASAAVALFMVSCASPSPDTRTNPSGNVGEKSVRGPQIVSATPEQLAEVIRRPGSNGVLVNVWATWCVPCREEFPDLLRVYRQYQDRGLRLVLISGDFDSELPAAQRFLSEQGVDFPTYIKAGDDMKFIDRLNPRWSGALPASFLYDGHGEQRQFWEGRIPYQALEERVVKLLSAGRTNP